MLLTRSYPDKLLTGHDGILGESEEAVVGRNRQFHFKIILDHFKFTLRLEDSVKTLCGGLTETNLGQHDEPQEEGHHSYSQDEELPAVLTPEGGGVHVHHGRHQALHTHKLTERNKEYEIYVYMCVCMFVCACECSLCVLLKYRANRI